MKKKIKKAFESTVWWSGVIMVGLVLGLSLQFVRAWTEPTEAPPGGNVGAPINTSPITQNKEGLLSAFGLMTSWFYKIPHPELGESNAVNSVLTLADPTTGKAAWAAGGGGGGGIYTRWGYDTCVGTDTKIYGGVALLQGASGDEGIHGNILCLDGKLSDRPNYREYTGAGTSWSDARGYIPGTVGPIRIPCAVCAR